MNEDDLICTCCGEPIVGFAMRATTCDPCTTHRMNGDHSRCKTETREANQE